MTIESLPSTPFSLPRITFGMLLGVDDFRTMLGHPRAKHLMHQAWLHGPGVIRGYEVTTAEHEVRVRPGLALDGMGRELPLRTTQCVDVADWLARGNRKLRWNSKLRLNVVATAGYLFTDPVPQPGGAVLDPLDPAASSASRYAETVTIDLVEAPKPAPDPFRQLYVLLGLAWPRPGDVGDAEAAGQARRIAKLAPGERPQALLAAFRDFAGRAVAALGPAEDWTDADAFPVAENAGLVLARVVVTSGTGGTPLLGSPDLSVRRSLLPTGVLQELLCGVGPAFPGRTSGDPADTGGPRVIRGSAEWLADRTMSVEVTADLRPGSLTRTAVAVSSVSDEGHWVVGEVSDVRYADRTITVQLPHPPRYDLVRWRVRGTGSTPVLGAGGRPLAGVDDGPAATGDDGRDAVWQMRGPQR
ncbi:hypothetical protein BJ973_008856 [Actinoplanes tereljensis]|uniref:Uncharacterized protein n=1 Tax=Paractinoplanes tereljensis TaxID=571912 RepID=A0A919NGH3_9ACTN|nr:hypothetical protein [Actinoplanes tereljensis]GIF18181.1 hypothetical protein Ate02nite_09110 [Actinoplanes tereljensis]